MSTKAENMGKIGPVLAEIFCRICQFLPCFSAVFAKIPQTFFLVSEVNELIFTIFSGNVGNIIAAVNACIPMAMLPFIVERENTE